MVARALTWAYRRLGRYYMRVFVTLELLTVIPVILGTYVLLSFYYEGGKGTFLLLFGITSGLALISVALICLKTYPLLKPIEFWIDGGRDPRSTAKAWSAAISFPWRMIRRVIPIPILVVALPSVALTVLVLELSPLAALPMIAGSFVALTYTAMLHYFAMETGLRPVLLDINQQVAPRTRTGLRSLSLRWRLLLSLPAINVITGVVVAALTSDGSGGADLGIDVAIAVAVATTLALELTVLLSRSILQPLADLRRATEAVLDGNYDVSIPVTTGDETGGLVASFNAMVQGLAERERIREAFGTYLDRDVAEYILSDSYDKSGRELDVSVLFTDVRGFTGFASGSEAKDVVAALNGLFEVIVPIIAKHGGHVDKFEGDGLLAVFGAPQPYPDHAVRAVRAGIEINECVNDDAEAGELRVGVGINTGRVVAGSIGGAGRLNFSVIGDAVNIAARVEGMTRETDRPVLLTAATAAALGRSVDLIPQGAFELRGVADAVELLAPAAVRPLAAIASE